MPESILMICGQFRPTLGGMAELSCQVARALHRLGRPVVVLAADAEADAAEFDRGQPMPVVRMAGRYFSSPPHRMLFARGAMLGQVRRLVRRHGAGYVLAATNLSPLLWTGLARLRLPMGCIFHGGELLRTASRSWLARRLSRRGNDCITDFFANSRYTAGLVKAAAGRPVEPVVIGCGLDAAAMPAAVERSAARARLGLEAGPVLLTICRLVPHKGVDRVIEALPEILARHPETCYVVAGGGPDRDRLAGLARRLGVAHRVRLEGRFPDELLAVYYGAADLFVMTSRQMPGSDVEGFGIVYLEAGHYGLAVIAGRAGGAPDAVADGRTGLLVDPESPRQIAAAVNRLLDDPTQRGRLGQAGRERADREMTWDAVGGRIARRIDERLGS